MGLPERAMINRAGAIIIAAALACSSQAVFVRSSHAQSSGNGISNFLGNMFQAPKPGAAPQAAPGPDGEIPPLLFTENETNLERLYGTPNAGPYVKDAFHEHVIRGKADAVNPARRGTKAAAHYLLDVPPRSHRTLRLRLRGGRDAGRPAFGE